jgi:hypothetical protein
MTLLIIIFILTALIISYIVGQTHGETQRREEVLAQLYSLSNFLDGEAKMTSDEIFNHLNRFGFINESYIKQKINHYRNENN